MKQTARDVARAALAAFRRDGAWSDNFLKQTLKKAGLDSRDAALATQLTNGVLQNRMLCDFYISSFSSLKLNKIAPGILDVLRVGVYQLLFLERIPAHAAINDAVCAARRSNPRVAGFVNAVLRNIDRSRDTLPVLPNDAIRFSHPEWLVDLIKEMYGEEVGREILMANNKIPKIMARVNTLICDEDAVLDVVPNSERHPWLKNCVVLNSPGDIEQLEGFRRGMFQVQDPASQLAALSTECKKGQKVLDTCSAPGGKSFVMAQMMENSGALISCDVHEHKLDLIQAGAKRLGITNLTTQLQDASVFREEFSEVFDVVLTDVPCSGLGVIRKKADIRYKDQKSIEALPKLQYQILCNASRYVSAGGTLVYSTCTINKQENENVIRSFLSEHSEFQLTPTEFPDPIGKTNGMLTMLPQDYDTDGFFICRLRRLA